MLLVLVVMLSVRYRSPDKPLPHLPACLDPCLWKLGSFLFFVFSHLPLFCFLRWSLGIITSAFPCQTLTFQSSPMVCATFPSDLTRAEPILSFLGHTVTGGVPQRSLPLYMYKSLLVDNRFPGDQGYGRNLLTGEVSQSTLHHHVLFFSLFICLLLFCTENSRYTLNSLLTVRYRVKKSSSSSYWAHGSYL